MFRAPGDVDDDHDSRRLARRSAAMPRARLLSGTVAALVIVGLGLALLGVDTPPRAPLVLGFLLAAPAAGVAAVLPGLAPASRATVALGGAIAVDTLVAQTMLGLRLWSPRGGLLVIAALSAALLLASPAVRRRRAARGPGREG